MELGPQNRNGDGLLGPNSIIVVYMDPLGYEGDQPAYKISISSAQQLQATHEIDKQYLEDHGT